IFLAAEFNCEISRLTSHRVCGVKRTCGVNEKACAADFTVLIDPVNLDDCFGGARKDFFNALADSRSGFRLRHSAQERLLSLIFICRRGLLLRKEQTAA